MVFGYLLARLVISTIFLPRYFERQIFTAYELMQRRFGPNVRKVSSGIFLITRALAEGVRRAGKTDGLAVARALREGGPVATVFGPVAFDAKGDAGRMTYEMNVWRDGQYEALR